MVARLITELGFSTKGPINFYCDKKVAISIARNTVQYDSTKHIEVDIIKVKLQSGMICTPFVKTGNQLTGLFTKGFFFFR